MYNKSTIVVSVLFSVLLINIKLSYIYLLLIYTLMSHTVDALIFLHFIAKKNFIRKRIHTEYFKLS